MYVFIMIDLILDGQIFVRRFPIGFCVECGDNCDPRMTMCDPCEAREHEIFLLEEMFNPSEITLP